MKQNGRGFSNHKGTRGCDVNRKDLRHEHLHCDLHTVTAVASVCGHAGEWPGPLVRDATAFDDKGMWRVYKCLVGRIFPDWTRL